MAMNGYHLKGESKGITIYVYSPVENAGRTVQKIEFSKLAPEVALSSEKAKSIMDKISLCLQASVAMHEDTSLKIANKEKTDLISYIEVSYNTSDRSMAHDIDRLVGNIQRKGVNTIYANMFEKPESSVTPESVENLTAISAGIPSLEKLETALTQHTAKYLPELHVTNEIRDQHESASEIAESSGVDLPKGGTEYLRRNAKLMKLSADMRQAIKDERKRFYEELAENSIMRTRDDIVGAGILNALQKAQENGVLSEDVSSADLSSLSKQMSQVLSTGISK